MRDFTKPVTAEEVIAFGEKMRAAQIEFYRGQRKGTQTALNEARRAEHLFDQAVKAWRERNPKPQQPGLFEDSCV